MSNINAEQETPTAGRGCIIKQKYFVFYDEVGSGTGDY